MSGGSAAKAAEAADALLDWLSKQPTRNTTSLLVAPPDTGLSGQGVEGAQSAPGWDQAVGVAPSPIAAPPEHQPHSATPEIRPAMRLPTPDWLHHRLTISGPAAQIGKLRKAAAGAGTIPWQLDLDRMEEDYFHLLVAPEQRSLSIADARIFARQLRDAVQRRHDLAVTRVVRSQAQPFDLHALVPVPGDILALGPDEPKALAWLWENWGTTQSLRHVAGEAVRPADGEITGEAETAFRLSFWSADWTPWRALKILEVGWPRLRFDVRPTYDTL